ncbi:MAG: hypothetical protein AAGI66_06410 [Cyanobacteria bacterium P01_H01_bin.74]
MISAYGSNSSWLGMMQANNTHSPVKHTQQYNQYAAQAQNSNTLFPPGNNTQTSQTFYSNVLNYLQSIFEYVSMVSVPDPVPEPAPTPLPLPAPLPEEPVPTPLPLPAPVSETVSGTPIPFQSLSPVVVQIDDYVTDPDGFNHGALVSSFINPDGGVDLLRYNIDDGGNRTLNIATGLAEIITAVQNGGQVNAVHIPQYDPSNNFLTQMVRERADQLSALGVPVVIAAGNNGVNGVNRLPGDATFEVMNLVNGQIDVNSGRGNLAFEGRSTSLSSASAAREIAELDFQGFGSTQIFSALGGVPGPVA